MEIEIDIDVEACKEVPIRTVNRTKFGRSNNEQPQSWLTRGSESERRQSQSDRLKPNSLDSDCAVDDRLG